MTEDGPDRAIRIMVVDDEPTQRLAVTLLCKSIGLPPVLAYSGAAEALTAIADGVRADLILCDLEMPEIDGMEFIRRMAGLRSAASVMILSGHPTPLLDSVERLGREHGLHMVGSAAKPLTRDRLEPVLTALRERTAGPDPSRTPLPTSAELDAMIDRGGFVPVFQPQVITDGSGRVVGAEVLARVRDGDGIKPLPAAFFDRLIERRRLADFTLEILDQAMAAAAAWPVELAGMRFSVNLTPTLFDDQPTMREIMGAVDRHGLKHERVTFELVETAVGQDPMLYAESAARLRLRGFGLAIDDFGQGHATLDQLRRLPFSELKIDRAFVTGIAGDPDNRTIVANTVTMAKALGLRVIVEGVETAEDARVVSDLGCDAAQGFLFAPGLSNDAFVAFVQARQGH